MARALGIDYGLRRTGLSITDPLRICVNPLPTIPTEELKSFIDSYLQKEVVDLIVFGDPYNQDGSPTEVNTIMRKFAESLQIQHPRIKFEFYNEQYTSARAVQVLIHKGTPKSKRNKTAIDQMSAVLILQDYLKHY